MAFGARPAASSSEKTAKLGRPKRQWVTESDHIVAETAARIFADLADPQTINNARDGAWKEPLWRALSDAGLPLAWVPEALRRRRRQSGRRIRGHRRRRPFCVAGAAGGNDDRRLAAGAGRYRCAGRRHDGRPGAPARHGDTECRRHVERKAPAEFHSLARRNTYGRCWRATERPRDRAGQRPPIAGSSEGLNLAGDASNTVTFERVKPVACAPAPDGFDVLADADGRNGAQRADRPARWRQSCRSASLTPMSASPSNARSENSRPCSRTWRGWPAKPPRRWRPPVRPPTPSRKPTISTIAVLLEVASAKIRCGEAGDRRLRPSRIRCMAPSASPTSTCCIASRCACWLGATISAHESYWAAELGEMVARRGCHEFWPMLASR